MNFALAIIHFLRDDFLSDARQAEAQAKAGPFYPGVTKESLLAYAGECRADAAQMTGAKEDEYVTECVRVVSVPIAVSDGAPAELWSHWSQPREAAA